MSKPNVRCWVITSHDTTVYKLWKKLNLTQSGIRYLCYQLERASTGKVHIQGYVEFYKQHRMQQVKRRLRNMGLHLEPRNGTRSQARDYALKVSNDWYKVNYPHWDSHGSRITGTRAVELGTWGTTQGTRTDLLAVSDLIKSGATEAQIFDHCPREYLKYSGHIKNALALQGQKLKNKFIKNFKVEVFYGKSRAGKTRTAFETYGPQNCYVPVWNGHKFWFDQYQGEKVLVINEFTGQAPLEMMQQLLDHYRQRLEVKGGSVMSNWDTVVITSQMHPAYWWNSYDCKTEEEQQSIVNRIDRVVFFESPSTQKKKKTWESMTSTPSGGKVAELVLPQPLPNHFVVDKMFPSNKIWATERVPTEGVRQSVLVTDNRS